MYIGLLFILCGCLLWYMEEKNAILNWTIVSSILLLFIGALILLEPLEKAFRHSTQNENQKKVELYTWHWFYILGLIFLGSIFYTMAAYLHLKMDEWTFLKALLIAIPFVVIEYQFSLRGNYYARKHLLMNSIQILVLTTIFCFFNAFLLNYFVLQHPVVVWRELLSIFFILMAFLTTTSI